MRADNNWEDSVGKRLYDFEGDLSPQSWDKINRRIQPKTRPRWWLWLPALLVFLALPLTFYLNHKANETTQNIEGQPIAINENRKGASQKESTGPVESIPNTALQKADLKTESPANDGLKQPAPENLATAKNQPIHPAEDHLTPAQPSKPKTNLPQVLIAEEKNDRVKEGEKAEPKKLKTFKPETGIIASRITKIKQKTVANSPEKPTSATASKVKGNPENAGDVKAEAIAKNQTSASVVIGKIPENTQLALKDKNTVKPENKAEGTTGTASETSAPENKGSGIKPEEKQPEAIIAAQDSAGQKGNVLEEAQVAKADSDKADQQALRKWTFAVYGSPQYTFQRVFANTEDEIMILRMNNQNTFETERLGYEFGFRSYFPITPKADLEIGLHFARLNQCLKFTMANQVADSVTVNNSNGQLMLDVTNREIDETILFKYFFGGLYIGGNFKLNSAIHFSAGIGSNLLLWKNPNEELVPIKTNQLNPYLSAGLHYQMPLNSNLTLQAGPTLQYYLRSVQQESAYYGVKPTTVGFTFKLLFNGK